MRVHHFGFAGLLLLALMVVNPIKAGALPGAYAGSVYGVQSDVIQVRRYKRYHRRHYHRRFYYYPPYGYYYYRPHRYYYRPYRYYNRPYYRHYRYRGYYPYYYGRPGISLYFRF